MTDPRTEEPMDEQIDHVDEQGNVIEVVSRGRMRAETLRHRCTYVAVVRSNGALVVHRRAEWKSIYPGFWDLGFGGVCGAGEDWYSAAVRELAEESGLTLDDLTSDDLVDLGAVRYDAHDGHIVGRVYLARSDAELTCPDGEVIGLDEIPLDDLADWMEGRDVALDSKAVMLPLLLGSNGRDGVKKS